MNIFSIFGCWLLVDFFKDFARKIMALPESGEAAAAATQPPGSYAYDQFIIF